jgi:hypothetical protein
MTKQNQSIWWFNYKLAALSVMVISLTAFTNISSKHSEPFKNSGVRETAPEGWFMAGMSPKDYMVSSDSLVYQQGHKSAIISNISDTPGGFCTLMQGCNIHKFKGKRVRMTGYIKTEGENTHAAMWARIDDFDNNITADFDNMDSRPIDGTNNWTKCEIVFDVPDANHGLFFGVIVNGKGKVWFDNVMFEAVGFTIQKTANNLNTPLPADYIANVKGGLTELPERLPKNLDFEE